MEIDVDVVEGKEIGKPRNKMSDENITGSRGESGGDGDDVVAFGEHWGESREHPSPPRGV